MSCFADSQDSIRFERDGGGIWVTLGYVTWVWSASVTNSTLQSTNVIGPSYVDSDEFPKWFTVEYNSK